MVINRKTDEFWASWNLRFPRKKISIVNILIFFCHESTAFNITPCCVHKVRAIAAYIYTVWFHIQSIQNDF